MWRKRIVIRRRFTCHSLNPERLLPCEHVNVNMWTYENLKNWGGDDPQTKQRLSNVSLPEFRKNVHKIAQCALHKWVQTCGHLNHNYNKKMIHPQDRDWVIFCCPNSEEGAAMSNQRLKCADVLHTIWIETKMCQNKKCIHLWYVLCKSKLNIQRGVSKVNERGQCMLTTQWPFSNLI